MAQAGFVIVMAVNAFSASSYQKECRRATARSKSPWAAVAQETGKRTLPSFVSVPGPSCAAAASGPASSRLSATSSRRAVMGGSSSSLVDVQAQGQPPGVPALSGAAQGVVACALDVAEQALEPGAAEEGGA